MRGSANRSSFFNREQLQAELPRLAIASFIARKCFDTFAGEVSLCTLCNNPC